MYYGIKLTKMVSEQFYLDISVIQSSIALLVPVWKKFFFELFIF